MSKPAKLAVVQINSQACYIKNVHLDQNIALVVYSEINKQWVSDMLYSGRYSAETLMKIAKFVYKQNQTDYKLAS